MILKLQCQKRVKNYFFDNIININDLDLDSISLDEKSCEHFELMMLHTKFHMAQILYVSIKHMDILQK